jgi:hypothetical protein
MKYNAYALLPGPVPERNPGLAQMTMESIFPLAKWTCPESACALQIGRLPGHGRDVKDGAK